MVCDNETSQAEIVQEEASSKSVLPFHPIAAESIWTHFWVDNFDIKVDKEVGKRSIHTTHLMAFQNVDESEVQKTTRNSIPKPKNRKIFIEDINIGSISVDRKKNPPTNFRERSDLCEDSFFNERFLSWTILHYQSSCNQRVPIFKGWNLQQRMEQDKSLIKTTENYLPTIDSKVTEFKTIYKYLQNLQGLASKLNMSYVHVSMDVGAAINAYLMMWNNPELFQNVILHLGGFHFLKENFQVRDNKY